MLLPRAGLRFVLAAIVCATPPIAYFLADRFDSDGFSRPNADGLLSRITFTQLVASASADWRRSTRGGSRALAGSGRGWRCRRARSSERS